jgi:hypothetical protein
VSIYTSGGNAWPKITCWQQPCTPSLPLSCMRFRGTPTSKKPFHPVARSPTCGASTRSAFAGSGTHRIQSFAFETHNGTLGPYFARHAHPACAASTERTHARRCDVPKCHLCPPSPKKNRGSTWGRSGRAGRSGGSEQPTGSSPARKRFQARCVSDIFWTGSAVDRTCAPPTGAAFSWSPSSVFFWCRPGLRSRTGCASCWPFRNWSRLGLLLRRFQRQRQVWACSLHAPHRHSQPGCQVVEHPPGRRMRRQSANKDAILENRCMIEIRYKVGQESGWLTHGMGPSSLQNLRESRAAFLQADNPSHSKTSSHAL